MNSILTVKGGGEDVGEIEITPSRPPPNTTINILNESKKRFHVVFGGGAEGGGGRKGLSSSPGLFLFLV